MLCLRRRPASVVNSRVSSPPSRCPGSPIANHLPLRISSKTLRELRCHHHHAPPPSPTIIRHQLSCVVN
ncbi:hypothetical protein DEO72_LG8g2219 [Vigna unguiculata]|uniref:Uncharacterized protein n=1 Tax=Vigna unguiculata TaxID=3917 RepID=A0A4D6MRU9_VIGUN|nr:hypothetical protein DEO72_LG8g2218 [Vigna unguiculata]QCE04186.1 hypothetical protein DEO72_LG8g2219 [Vigna unguiculata]